MLFLVTGYELIYDSIHIGADQNPEVAINLFKERYPESSEYQISVRSCCGGEYNIEGRSKKKDIIDAPDKDLASRIFRGKYPTMLNKKSNINVYTIEEWQDTPL